MKYELDLVRSSKQPGDFIDPAAARLQPTTPSRKAIRELTDAIIHDALLLNDLPALVKTLAATMLAVAEAVDRHDIEPHVGDFVNASRGLVEHSRTVADRGLLITDWQTAKQGAVMLELTVRGVCAALSVPYDDVMREVHRASVAGEPADVLDILVKAGLMKGDGDEAASNP